MTAPLLLSATLAYPGFALLCLCMPRHEHQVLGRGTLSPRSRVLVRLGGWLLLAASLVPALGLANPGIGLVAWTGMLAVAAAPLVLGLPHRPRTVALAGPSLALLAAGLQLAGWAAGGS